MKKLFLIGVALLAFACSNDDNKKNDGDVQEYEIALEPNNNNPWEWRYITLADGETVEEANAWDIAILRYSAAEMAIRTSFDEENDTYPIKYMTGGPGGPGIGVREDLVWSGVKAMDMATRPDDPDMFQMPPVYLRLPAHEFTSADGEHTYSVKFTGYSYQDGILYMEVAEL